MLPRLEALLQASPKVASFQVVDSDAIDEDNFLLKIRCELTSGCTFQIRLRAVASHIRYSYQEFTIGRCGVGITRHIFLIFQAFPTIIMTRKETLPHPC